MAYWDHKPPSQTTYPRQHGPSISSFFKILSTSPSVSTASSTLKPNLYRSSSFHTTPRIHGSFDSGTSSGGVQDTPRSRADTLASSSVNSFWSRGHQATASSMSSQAGDYLDAHGPKAPVLRITRPQATTESSKMRNKRVEPALVDPRFVFPAPASTGEVGGAGRRNVGGPSERESGTSFVASLGLAPLLDARGKAIPTSLTAQSGAHPLRPSNSSPHLSPTPKPKEQAFSLSHLGASLPASHYASDELHIRALQPTSFCETWTFPHPRIAPASPPLYHLLPAFLPSQQQLNKPLPSTPKEYEPSVVRVLRENQACQDEREQWRREFANTTRFSPPVPKSFDSLRRHRSQSTRKRSIPHIGRIGRKRSLSDTRIAPDSEWIFIDDNRRSAAAASSALPALPRGMALRSAASIDSLYIRAVGSPPPGRDKSHATPPRGAVLQDVPQSSSADGLGIAMEVVNPSRQLPEPIAWSPIRPGPTTTLSGSGSGGGSLSSGFRAESASPLENGSSGALSAISVADNDSFRNLFFRAPPPSHRYDLSADDSPPLSPQSCFTTEGISGGEQSNRTTLRATDGDRLYAAQLRVASHDLEEGSPSINSYGQAMTRTNSGYSDVYETAEEGEASTHGRSSRSTNSPSDDDRPDSDLRKNPSTIPSSPLTDDDFDEVLTPVIQSEEPHPYRARPYPTPSQKSSTWLSTSFGKEIFGGPEDPPLMPPVPPQSRYVHCSDGESDDENIRYIPGCISAGASIIQPEATSRDRLTPPVVHGDEDRDSPPADRASFIDFTGEDFRRDGASPASLSFLDFSPPTSPVSPTMQRTPPSIRSTSPVSISAQSFPRSVSPKRYFASSLVPRSPAQESFEFQPSDAGRASFLSVNADQRAGAASRATGRSSFGSAHTHTSLIAGFPDPPPLSAGDEDDSEDNGDKTLVLGPSIVTDAELSPTLEGAGDLRPSDSVRTLHRPLSKYLSRDAEALDAAETSSREEDDEERHPYAAEMSTPHRRRGGPSARRLEEGEMARQESLSFLEFESPEVTGPTTKKSADSFWSAGDSPESGL